jgi:flagellar hook-associated protein 1
MGLMNALNAAVSGLRTNQVGIDLVAKNVANADSAGYSRRVSTPTQSLIGDQTFGVRTGKIERILDEVAQRQLRLETSGASYTALRANYTNELDRLFGSPGGDGALDTSINNLTQAMQNLVADPGSYSSRTALLDAGAQLAARIGSISNSVQGLRNETESRINSAVKQVNELIGALHTINDNISKLSFNQSDPGLLDERDRLVTELSQFVDVQVRENPNGSVNIQTSAGLSLVDAGNKITLTFDARSNIGPDAVYSEDNNVRGVGTIKAVGVNGAGIDVVSGKLIRSGELGAALELRDKTLVQAQRQLDELAAGLAKALSDKPAPVTTPVVANFTGFDIDLTGLQSGNAITLDYKDITAGGVQKRVIFVPVNGTTPTSIDPAQTYDPSASVVPINISSGFNAAFAAIGTALGTRFTVTQPLGAGTATLRILDDGTANTTDITKVSADITVTSLSSGQSQLPFFVDGPRGNIPFTGHFDNGSQLTGFAQRMAVNPALIADRSKLTVYGTGIPSGDTTRPQFIIDALTKGNRTFSAASGIGGANAPYTSNVVDFGRRIIEHQGAGSENAKRLNEGQKVALSTIESRFAASSGVNIDQEMAQLVQLQNAYSANARVMTAARDMMELLFRI